MKSHMKDRAKRRIPCDIFYDGRKHSGVVLDLSHSGLFIQTKFKADRGVPLDLELNLPGVEGKLAIKAEVARQKGVPARLVTAIQGGLGVRIRSAPNPYFEFVASVVPGQGGALEKQAAAPLKRFRVRASQVSGSRSRTFVIEGSDEEQARTRALEKVGEGWKILQIGPA